MGVRAAWRALWDRGADDAPAIKAAPPRLASAWGGFEPGSGRQPWAPGARLDFAREAGNLADNAVVAIGLAWLRRQVPQGVLRIGRTLDDGTREPIDGHPAQAVLRRPNPIWSLASTLGGTSDALCLDANSYWIKARNRGGKGLVSELYWVPNTAIELEYDQDPRAIWPIARYRYQPGGLAEQNYEPRDVLHFRDGIDPEKPALGLSALRRQPRNVASLNHGERYSEAVLRKGHAGVVLTPEEALAAGYGNALSPDEAGMLAEKQRFERYLTGENAGGVHATTQPMRIQNAGLSPEEMGLDRILDRPETMVLAALGLNALVLGLPSSSGTRTYANYAEARRDAWESAVIPRQDLIAETLTQQLLYTLDDDGQPVPEWPGDGLDLVVYWDRSEVAALREDASERVTRATAVFTATLLPRDRALAEGGLEPVGGEEGEAYYGDPGTSSEPEPGPDQGEPMPPDGWEDEDEPEPEPELDDTEDGLDAEDETDPVKALRGAGGGKRRKVKGGVRRTASGKERPAVDGDRDGRIHDGTAREAPAPAGAASGKEWGPIPGGRLTAPLAKDVSTTPDPGTGFKGLPADRADAIGARIARDLEKGYQTRDRDRMEGALGRLETTLGAVRDRNYRIAERLDDTAFAALEKKATAAGHGNWEDYLSDESAKHTMRSLGAAVHRHAPSLCESGRVGDRLRMDFRDELGAQNVERFLIAAHDPDYAGRRAAIKTTEADEPAPAPGPGESPRGQEQ